jgi:large subunit ribosomal protein L13
MDMNKSFVLKKEEHVPGWCLIDATGKVLGRLATKVADMLRGKDRPEYTPHTDSGSYVVIINCEKICLTGNKMEDKVYKSYSGWMGGKKELTVRQVMEKDPTRIIKSAVKGMLPKNKLNNQIIKKLKLYVGSDHPHSAQLGNSR